MNNTYTHLDLFSGIGGCSLAAKSLSNKSVSTIKTKQFVEIDSYCQQVLSKNFPGVPIHSDICDFQGSLGQFDIITGGFPCTDLSVANSNGKGLQGERSGLWFEYLRLINEIKPKGIVIENVCPTPNQNWLQTVLKGLDESRYNAQWRTFRASDFGYYHQRRRIFIIAYSNSYRQSKNGFTTQYFKKGLQETRQPKINCTSYSSLFRRISESESIRVFNGVSNRLDKHRIKALGNALVPAIAEFALKSLIEIIEQLSFEN